MCGGHEQPRHEILFAHLHAAAAFAAAPLRAIGRERHALDVALVRDSDHHVLALDQVFFLDLAGRFRDHGPARRGKFLLHSREFILDDRLDTRARTQDIEIVGDLGGELVEFFLDFVAAERGQPLQAQIEDGFGLLDGKPCGALGN